MHAINYLLVHLRKQKSSCIAILYIILSSSKYIAQSIVSSLLPAYDKFAQQTNSWIPYGRVKASLKGLSYEIDFENVDENWQILALVMAAAGSWIFRRYLCFLVEIKHPVNAQITPIAYVIRLILGLYSRQACQCRFMGNQSEAATVFCKPMG